MKESFVPNPKQSPPAQSENKPSGQDARVSEVIANFANGVSHDLNNITAIILGYAEELRDDLGPNDPRLPDIIKIIQAGERANALSEKLSTIAQKISPELSDTDLNDNISLYMNAMQSILGEKITITFDPAAHLKPVRANQQSIKQLLLNFASFARTVMTAGGTLSISTKQPEDVSQAGFILLSITDPNKEIASDNLHRIFEPYSDFLGSGKNNGISLALVYSIVKQLAGSITVESATGNCLVFRIYLPVAPAAAVVDSLQPAEPTPTKGNNELVLIVDDDPKICAIVQRMIDAMGFRSAVFSDSRAALAAIEGGIRPYIVISDLIMPEIDGIELISQIKNILPDVGVILISGYTDKLFNRARILADKPSLLAKPFTQAELSGSIMDVLHKKKSQAKQSVDIFILDDDEHIRILLGRTCAKRGHNLMGAESLEEALDILAKHSFDILLIDQSLLGMSGTSALREIRKAGINTPASIFTGAVLNDYTEIMKELNVIQVIEKSFNNNPLLDFVEEYLEKN